MEPNIGPLHRQGLVFGENLDTSLSSSATSKGSGCSFKYELNLYHQQPEVLEGGRVGVFLSDSNSTVPFLQLVVRLAGLEHTWKQRMVLVTFFIYTGRYSPLCGLYFYLLQRVLASGRGFVLGKKSPFYAVLAYFRPILVFSSNLSNF